MENISMAMSNNYVPKIGFGRDTQVQKSNWMLICKKEAYFFLKYTTESKGKQSIIMQ